MPIEVSCPSCNARMRVPDTAAGKRVRCPKCQQGVISVPAATSTDIDAPTMFAAQSPVKTTPKLSATSSTVAPKTAAVSKPKVENWSMQSDDGQTYGPVSKTELDQWYAEGRVTSECQLLREGADQWQWASEVYPLLAGAEGAPAPAEGAPAAPAGENPFDFFGGEGGAPAASAPANAEASPFDFGAPATTSSATKSPSSTSARKGAKGKGKGGKAGRGEVGTRSKLVAGLLAIFLGGWGIHQFYLGDSKAGIIRIVVTLCTCGFGSIWGLIEGIMIFTGSINKDAQGFALKD